MGRKTAKAKQASAEARDAARKAEREGSPQDNLKSVPKAKYRRPC